MGAPFCLHIDPSWLHLDPSWLSLAPSWPHVGPSWLHLEPSWLPKASPDHPKISFGAQRLPRANIAFFERPMSKLSRESFDPEQTFERILREKCASLSTPFSRNC